MGWIPEIETCSCQLKLPATMHASAANKPPACCEMLWLRCLAHLGFKCAAGADTTLSLCFSGYTAQHHSMGGKCPAWSKACEQSFPSTVCLRLVWAAGKYFMHPMAFTETEPGHAVGATLKHSFRLSAVCPQHAYSY